MSYLVGQTVGRYHVIEQLGQGGMATVYRAYDTRLRREVALKVIRSDVISQDQLELLSKRFEREAVSLAKLSHPNIVGVFDYGEHEGYPYLVMEFIDGGSLRQRLTRHMPWQDAVRLIIPIAHALDYAHKRKLVHRDIKPANILITSSDTPKLTDFGIAKILEPGEVALTGTGVGIGTPEYMSPEQGMGKAIDHRTDIYSLGVVLYEMVTGQKPYTADTPIAVMLKHIKDPLPRPKNIRADLPEEIERVLFVALAKNPEDRYQSMESFAHSLERLLLAETASSASQKASTLAQPPAAGTVTAYPAPPTASQPAVQPTRTTAAYPAALTPAQQASVPPPVMNYPQYPSQVSYPAVSYPAVPVEAKKRSPWGWLLGIGGVVIMVLCLIVVASGGYYFYQQKQSQDRTATAESRRSTERAEERTAEAATQAAYPDLHITNSGSTDICYFYLSEAGSTNIWGDELLDGDTIYIGDDYTIEDIEPGDYDILAQDCGYSNIDLGSNSSMSIYDDSELTINASVGTGDGSTVNLFIVNDTDITICYVRYSAGGAPSWEGDLLGSSTLAAYTTFTASLSPGEYDLAAEDCNGHTMLFNSYYSVYGDTYWYVEGYCGNGTCNSWEDASTCSSDCGSSGGYGSINLTIYNQTNTTVCWVYYAPVGASDWSGDLLGSSVLSANSSYTAAIDPGNYQLQAEDCDHNVMYYEPNYSVYSNAAWYIY